MATKEFIFQGFTPRTHVAAIHELFDVPDIQRVMLSIAFITESGVDLIGAPLKHFSGCSSVFAGIRNDITSHQGLNRLRGFGLQLYAVDTGSRNVIFHPKLYLVRGKNIAKLVIGSSNLTLGGLNNNVEAGLLVQFDLKDSHDASVVSSIESNLDVLPGEYPKNIFKIDNKSILDDMLSSGRLTDELAVPPPRPSTSASLGSSDQVSRIVLEVKPLRRALDAAKKAQQQAKATPAAPANVATKQVPAPVPAAVGVEYDLVWESKPLTRRDLTIPTATNTHATGSVNLDKGLLDEAIDHRHYFRDIVFSNLSWLPTTAAGTVEQAYAKFQLVLKAVSYGEFDLRIGHTTDVNSKGYLQRNAMTRLSWGPMRTYIARDDLIGRTLALYRDKADPKRFVLEID